MEEESKLLADVDTVEPTLLLPLDRLDGRNELILVFEEVVDEGGRSPDVFGLIPIFEESGFDILDCGV